ncbi:MAG TPA: hypothetical protein VFG23_24770 [Polyangia bacterium]|nr:hypothetical protein [Polyangia bacterium]
MALKSSAIACACLGASILAGGIAAATSTDPAQRLFARGVENARQGHWDEARVAFEGAYALSPRPVIRINLAGAQARTGYLKEASANYRAIASDASIETAPFRDTAAAVLATLEPRIPRIRLGTMGLGEADVVKIDGASVATDDVSEPQPLDPGPHTVTVWRADTERARIDVSLAEGETHDVSLPSPAVLKLEAPAPSEVNDPFTPNTEKAPSPVVAGTRRTWWRSPWTWTAVATVAGVVTAGLLVMTHEGSAPFSGSVSPGIIHVQ